MFLVWCAISKATIFDYFADTRSKGNHLSLENGENNFSNILGYSGVK